MKNYIVTIAREYGSGGRECGKKLAELTGYKFYDKDLITLAAQKSGMSTDALNSVDEKAASSLLYTLALGSSIYNSGMGNVNLPINDKLFVVQSQIIKDIANSGEGAIIVGRCADYVLSERDNVVKVYITSDFDTRVNTVMKRHDLTQSQARDLIIKTDKRRSNYYNFYTNNTWGDVNNYNICLDTASLPPEKCVDILIDYIQTKLK